VLGRYSLVLFRGLNRLFNHPDIMEDMFRFRIICNSKETFGEAPEALFLSF